ncbi:hypothetical protein VTI74DRAFT_4661 [Chaetomium olivicolor]
MSRALISDVYRRYPRGVTDPACLSIRCLPGPWSTTGCHCPPSAFQVRECEHRPSMESRAVLPPGHKCDPSILYLPYPDTHEASESCEVPRLGVPISAVHRDNRAVRLQVATSAMELECLVVCQARQHNSRNSFQMRKLRQPGDIEAQTRRGDKEDSHPHRFRVQHSTTVTNLNSTALLSSAVGSSRVSISFGSDSQGPPALRP